jgi:hypothetical protein
VSTDTKAALDSAIQAHFGDVTEGGLVTGYVLQVKGKTTEDLGQGDQTSYLREVPAGQDSDNTLGLFDYGHTQFRAAVVSRWVPAEDDD